MPLTARYRDQLILAVCVLLAFIVVPTWGQSSATYSIAAHSVDAGGGLTTSANYSQSSVSGQAVGVEGVESHSFHIQGGYVGQLATLVSVEVAVVTTNLVEGDRVLAGQVSRFDDGTLFVESVGAQQWMIVAGPLRLDQGQVVAELVSVTSTGLASWVHSGTTNVVEFRILNVPDGEFHGYAADDIDDAWQVAFFGYGNSNAAGFVDYDGDGQDNRFEYIAGLDPTRADSRFLLFPSFEVGMTNGIELVFQPVVPGREYRLMTATNLSGPWSSVPNVVTNNSDDVRTLVDPSPRKLKFYRVNIVK